MTLEEAVKAMRVEREAGLLLLDGEPVQVMVTADDVMRESLRVVLWPEIERQIEKIERELAEAKKREAT